MRWETSLSPFLEASLCCCFCTRAYMQTHFRDFFFKIRDSGKETFKPEFYQKIRYTWQVCFILCFQHISILSRRESYVAILVWFPIHPPSPKSWIRPALRSSFAKLIPTKFNICLPCLDFHFCYMFPPLRVDQLLTPTSPCNVSRCSKLSSSMPNTYAAIRSLAPSIVLMVQLFFP